MSADPQKKVETLLEKDADVLLGVFGDALANADGTAKLQLQHLVAHIAEQQRAPSLSG